MSRGLQPIIGAALCATQLLAGCRGAIEKIYVRKETYTDLRPHLEVYAKKIRPHAAPTKWERMLDAQEVDALRRLDDDTVLVGFMRMTNPAGAFEQVIPKYSDLAAVSASSGKVLWTSERKGDEDVAYHVLDVAGVVLVLRATKRKTSIIGLDPASGNEVWSAELKGREPAVARSRDGQIAVVTESQLGLIDPRTGAWLMRETNDLGDDAVIIPARDELFFLGGDRVRSVSAGSLASTLWTLPADAISTTAALDGTLLVGSKKGVSSHDSRGTVLWNVHLPRLRAVDVVGETVLVQTEVPAGGRKLSAFDATNGSVQWESTTQHLVASGIVRSSSHLCLSTRTALIVLNAATGETVARESLPKTVPLARLPDTVTTTAAGCAFTGETFAAGISLTTPEEMWVNVLDQGRVEEFREVGNDKTAASKGEIRGISPVTKGLLDGSSNLWRSEQQHRTAAQSARTRGNDSQAASLERQARAEAEVAKAATQAAMISAASDLGQALGKALRDAGVKRALEARIANEFTVAVSYAANSVHGYYWVRPVTWKSALGLVVVDLRDGSWVELPTQVRESIIHETPFYDTHPSTVVGNTLVTKGISLDPARWGEDKQAFPLITAQRSLLAYSLDALEFHPRSEFAHKSWSAVGDGAKD